LIKGRGMRMKFLNFREKQINDRKLLSLIEVDKDRLYRIAYVYVKNEEDAKEIVQETIYKGFLNIKKLKEVEKFNSWITRILVNTAMTHLKKKNRFVYEGEDVLKNVLLQMKTILIYMKPLISYKD